MCLNFDSDIILENNIHPATWYVIEVHGEKHIHMDKRHGWSINPSHGQRMSLSGQRGQYGNQL